MSSFKVHRSRQKRLHAKAYAVANACNELQQHLLTIGKAGSIIGYEVGTTDVNAAEYLAETGDWIVDVIYAERPA